MVKWFSMLTSVSDSHFQQFSQRWRNDNISLDMCYQGVTIGIITSLW